VETVLVALPAAIMTAGLLLVGARHPFLGFGIALSGTGLALLVLNSISPRR
jgi:hypothetical protein